MDIFTRMAGVSTRLLRPASEGGFGSGTISLVRLTSVPGVEVYDPPTTTRVVTPLRANAFGVSAQLVGVEYSPGNAIVASDKRVISAPIAGGYEPEDIMEIDGKPVTVLRVKNIVGAGVVSAVEFIVRG